MVKWRVKRSAVKEASADSEYVEIDPSQLDGLFVAPSWLRDAGISSWLLVGVAVLTAAMIWILSLTSTIVMPLITAGIIAAVAGPLVRKLGRVGVPRGAGSAVVMLLFVVAAFAVTTLVVGGIKQQADSLVTYLSDAQQDIQTGLEKLGISETEAADTVNTGGDSVTKSLSGLLEGVASGIASIASLAFFLAITTLILFFLLKDGPQIRAWTERRMGVPREVAHVITQRLMQSLRGYFFGVTIVAAWNALLISLGALLLDVPSVGTLALVTFIGAYIPYLGAWVAGIFAVLVALGGAGTEAAIAMAVIVLLANGVLQQIVQPIAYGAALGIHPLAVLVVTIGGGALFGAVGLILAAPITSAVVRISADLAGARERPVNGAGQGDADAEPAPA